MLIKWEMMDFQQTESFDMYDNVTVYKKSLLTIDNVTTEFSNLISHNSYDDAGNDTKFANDTMDYDYEQREYIFDRKEVKVIFITLYSLVFCCCFFGKFIKV